MIDSEQTPFNEYRDVIQIVRDIAEECGISDREGLLLYHYAKNSCKEGVIVEIGSWKGVSTIWLAKGTVAGNGVKVYAIDPHKGTLWHIIEQQLEDTYPIFQQNIKRAGVENIVIPIVMKSEEAIKGWRKPISLLWIDGSHEYENVKRDFILYEPYLLEGGIIAFHDCWHPGVSRVIREKILASRRFRDIGHLERTIFATKAKEHSSGDKQVVLRLRLFIMSYACDSINLLTKYKFLEPVKRFIFGFGKKILALGGRW